MKRINPILFITGAVILALGSCIKSETVYYDELDVTLTQYDTEFNFSSYTRFAMPDSTILKSNYLKDEEIEAFYAPGGASEQTLDIQREKYESRGYVYTDSYDDADFVAVPTLLMMEYSGAVYYPPGWWWGYPGWGWGYPGWGWGYPWYPGYGYTYQYKTGTIVLEMVDGDSFRTYTAWLESLAASGGQPAADDEVPSMKIRWMATIDGYVSSNVDYNKDRAQKGIDEAFEQSPYLMK